jgi:hypothetical protein
VELSIINTYQIADNTIENANSLLKSVDETRVGMSSVSIANFDNDAVPALKRGSIIEVGGSFFIASADGIAQYIAQDFGSQFVDVLSAPENTDLYLCMVPSGVGKVVFALKACTSVYFDADYRGFYESGTLNRVIGGCQRVGTTFPVTKKWIYPDVEQFPRFLKVYNDGVTIHAKKILQAPRDFRGTEGPWRSETRMFYHYNGGWDFFTTPESIFRVNAIMYLGFYVSVLHTVAESQQDTRIHFLGASINVRQVSTNLPDWRTAETNVNIPLEGSFCVPLGMVNGNIGNCGGLILPGDYAISVNYAQYSQNRSDWVDFVLTAMVKTGNYYLGAQTPEDAITWLQLN